MTIKAIWGAAHDHSMYTQKAQEVFEDLEKNVNFRKSCLWVCAFWVHILGSRAWSQLANICISDIFSSELLTPKNKKVMPIFKDAPGFMSWGE